MQIFIRSLISLFVISSFVNSWSMNRSKDLNDFSTQLRQEALLKKNKKNYDELESEYSIAEQVILDFEREYRNPGQAEKELLAQMKKNRDDLKLQLLGLEDEAKKGQKSSIITSLIALGQANIAKKQSKDLVKFNKMLELAVEANDYEDASHAISSGAHVQWLDGQTKSKLIHHAIRNTEMLQLLIACGVDCNLINEHGDTPLHRAANMGYLNSVRLLLENKSDPLAKSASGATPLHYAVTTDLDCVQLLLSAGGYHEIRNHKEKAAFEMAVNSQQPEIVKLLLEYQPNITDEYKEKVEKIINSTIKQYYQDFAEKISRIIRRDGTMALSLVNLILSYRAYN